MLVRILSIASDPASRSSSTAGGSPSPPAPGRAEFTRLRLSDYDLPVYDGAWEAEHGLPETARDLQRLFSEHDGLVFELPDGGGECSAALLNLLSWLERPDPLGTSRLPLRGKVAAMVPAGGDPAGRSCSEAWLPWVLDRFGVMVVPPRFTMGRSAGPSAIATVSDSTLDVLVEVIRRLLGPASGETERIRRGDERGAVPADVEAI